MNTVTLMQAAGYDPQPARRAFDQIIKLADGDLLVRQACVNDICEWLRTAWREDHWRRMTPGAKRLASDISEILRRRLNDPRSPLSWCGLDFNLSYTIIRTLDLSGAHFTGGTTDFSGSIFGEPRFLDVDKPGGWRVLGVDQGPSFSEAIFSGGNVVFDDATFLGIGRGAVTFSMARFEDTSVTFRGAQFHGGEVVFDDILCQSGSIAFDSAIFREVSLSFARAEVEELFRISFQDARFLSGSTVSFDRSGIRGEVSFRRAEVYGSLYLAGAVRGRGSVRLDSAQAGGLILFQNLAIDGGEVSLRGLQVKYGTLQIEDAKLSGGDLIFDGVVVSGGQVLLNGIWLERGSLSFMNARVVSDALVYLPWGTYGESYAVSVDSDFDGKSRWKFEREDAHYQPGVVREWGPFAPINS